MANIIRLYPILKQGVTINKIVRVSNKKYQKYIELKELKKKHPEEFLDMVEMDEELSMLDFFDNYGWGTFKPIPEMLDENGNLTTTGELHDMERIKMLFLDNGFSFLGVPMYINGVYWLPYETK